MWVVGFLLLVSPIWTAKAQQSLVDLLARHEDLSEFTSLVRGSPFLNASLPWRQGTLFAPTNNAIKKHRDMGGRIDNHTLLYHFANVAKRTSDLEDFVSTELPGNPPIWISRNPTSESDIFLNDARIDAKRRNFQVKNSIGMDQVLHVIDRVLDPTVPDSTGDSSFLNPDARKFMEGSSYYNITGMHQITKFAQRVAQLFQSEMFKAVGNHTYFIPVDDAFNSIQPQTVDGKVIQGHIIPNHVLFLRPSQLQPHKKEYPTAAMAPFFPVLVSIEEGKGNKFIVRSDTREAVDQFHRKGVVQTEVVKGNIPVRNGVVHLINKPLVIIDQTVYQTLANEKQDGPTYQFFKMIYDLRDEYINEKLQNPGQSGITVFVPSNEELSSPGMMIVRSNRTLLAELVRLHIVLDTIRSENITGGHERAPFQAETLDAPSPTGNPIDPSRYPANIFAPKKRLFFNYNYVDGRTVLYVEGGGVNATITQPDIGATNGVIHMIDKLLGHPNQDVYGKLATDPMLTKTYELTSQQGYNLRYNSSNLRFTLFAPNNLAWGKIYQSSPSEFKKLQMGDFSYHVQRIIERHTLVGKAYTIEELRDLSANASNRAFPIQAVHGILRVENKEDMRRHSESDRYQYGGRYYTDEASSGPYEYSVFWMNVQARVVRPNIICTNGIIHIVDTVLMQPDDVTVAYVALNSSKSPLLKCSFVSVVSLAVLSLLRKWTL